VSNLENAHVEPTNRHGDEMVSVHIYLEYSHRLLILITEILLTVHQKYVNQCNTIILMRLFLQNIFGLHAQQVKTLFMGR